MSNSDVWPVIRSRCVACPDASASSSPSRSCAGCPNMLSAPDLGQRLEHLAVGEPQVDPRAEVRQRPELAAALARLDDRLDGALADVLDRQQAEADRVALDREPEARAVHVGRPDLDAQAPALDDRGGHLLGVVPERREHRGHVLDRVVGLEVRRLVRDQAVAGGVRLVEPVALERLERLEHGVDDLGLDAPLRRLGDELLLLRAQHRGLLLADRVAQGVRLGAREPAQGDRGGHDVLLVHEDPVGLLQVRLEQRVEVGHRLLAVLATDVGRDVVHRARAVERDHGGEVEHRRRPQLADVAAHARGLELEHAGRLARGEQLERRLVVERDASRGRPRSPRLSRMRSTALRRIVRLDRPRKSNLSRPSASMPCISYWVISASELVARWSGMSSVSGSRLMTTPAACVEALRATPSSWRANPISRSTWVSRVVHLLELGRHARAPRRA